MNDERRRCRNTWKDVTIYRYIDINNNRPETLGRTDYIYGRHNWKHLGRNQDTDRDKSTNDGEQEGPYKGEKTKAEEDKV